MGFRTTPPALRPTQMAFASPLALPPLPCHFKCLHDSPSPSLVPSHRRRPRHPQPQMSLLIDFSPSDFEIRRIVGQQGYATITDWEYYGPRDPLAPTRTVQPSTPTIRLYDARIVSSIPYLYNARVLLKEFLSDGVELGVTEAEAYKILYEADGSGIDPDVVPVATLLGTFLTDQSFDRAAFAENWKTRFPRSPIPPRSGTPFLVFRWEGIQTGMTCAAQPDRDVDPGTQLLNRWLPGNLLRRKTAYVCSFMKQSLEALLYLHATAGIVHRAIGLASIMVNTTEYRLASSLQVKIRDLGFAKTVSQLIGTEDLEKARKAGAVTPTQIASFYFSDDVYALGYAFLELLFSVFSGRPVTQDQMKSLFEDTFKLDIQQFRDYCAEDPQLGDAVALLDNGQGAGWELIKDMLSARQRPAEVSLQQLSESSFLQDRF